MEYKKINDNSFKTVELQTNETVFYVNDLISERGDLLKRVDEIDVLLLEAEKIGVEIKK